ncbi:MAG: leucine-rich repeat domain-containing protein, partial [Gammaproteobacteria bacterium]|nr:leucine-rich repeat domain-containing protein [Gammaproteobacteria bacterium]
MDKMSKIIIKLVNIFILSTTLLHISKSFAVPLPILPDPALNNCLIEQVIANNWTTAEDVTALSCINKNIERLDGMEAFVNLLKLNLSNNNIFDISSLSSLGQLTALYLSDNPYIEASQAFNIIASNINLTHIGLNGITINGPVPVFKTPADQVYSLIELDVGNTGITNISGIEQYATLQKLNLANNQIQDIGQLSTLSVNELDLSNNNVIDASPLSSYTQLTALYLSGNKWISAEQALGIINNNLQLTRIGLNDINFAGSPTYGNIPAFINNLTSQVYPLVELKMANTGISTILGVEQYNNTLRTLDIANNNIENISLLSNLQLTEVNLSDNKISDFSPLLNQTHLTLFNVSRNYFFDNWPYQTRDLITQIISNNPGLTHIGLSGLKIDAPFPVFAASPDWQPYALIDLDLSDTGVSEIYGIELYTTLKNLNLANNSLTTINQLSNMPLSQLDISNNHITDISLLLNSINGLRSINLSGNKSIPTYQISSFLNQNYNLTHIGLNNTTYNEGIPLLNHPMIIVPYKLYELDLGNNKINNIWNVDKYPTLKSLKIANNLIDDISPLSFTNLSLMELDISGNNVSDISALFGYKQLRKLNLSHNNFSEDYPMQDLLRHIITDNQQLTHIGINGFPTGWINLTTSTGQYYKLIELDIGNTGIAAAIPEIPTLRKLNLSGNNLTIIPGLTPPVYLNNLRELDISNNSLTDISHLINDAQITELKKLNLSNNPGIPHEQVSTIINQNHRLTHINLNNVVLWHAVPVFTNPMTNSPYQLVELELASSKIETLWGLEQYTSLKKLNLADNDLIDISLLSGLQLSELNLSNNLITDITPLQGFDNLTTLHLSGNSEIDANQALSIISSNYKLARIGLNDIPVAVIPPLTDPTTGNPYQLLELNLANTGLIHLLGIDQFSKLQSLNLANNRLTDISPLSNLPLRELNLSNNDIGNINPLNSFSELTALYISGNIRIPAEQAIGIINSNQQLTHVGLNDIFFGAYTSGSLPGFFNYQTGKQYKLQHLEMSNTGISSIYGIESFSSSLKSLNLANNPLSDISTLTWFPNTQLTALDLSGNQIVSIDPIRNFTRLNKLYLSNNNFDTYELQSIWNMINNNPGLTHLGLNGINFLYDGIFTTPQAQPYRLVELDLGNNGPRLLPFEFSQYQTLKKLNLENSGLIDITPLQTLHLRELNLSNNQLTSLSALGGQLHLKAINLAGNTDIAINDAYWLINQNTGLNQINLNGIAINGPAPLFSNIASGLPYHLTHLDLGNTGLTDIIQISQYDSLNVLNLSGNDLVNIDPLTSNIDPVNSSSLRELDLSHNQIIDIYQLTSFRNLTHLNLSGNTGINATQAFDVISSNTGLTHIGLSGINFPQGSSLPWFDQFTGQPYHLIELDMSNTGLTDTQAIPMSGYTHLKKLNLANNNLLFIDTYSFVDLNQILLVDLTGNTNLQCNSMNSLIQSLGTDVVIAPSRCAVGNVPRLDIYAPADGSIFHQGQTIYLDAFATDSEDGNLSANIQWSSSITGILGSNGLLTTQLDPGIHTLTASVADSDNNTAWKSITITVEANIAPIVSITSPASGSNYILGDITNLTGNAIDNEDGDISSSIQWTSNINGSLGTGSQVGVNLAEGTHSITANIADSLGATNQASITINVYGDSDLDGMNDLWELNSFGTLSRDGTG